MNNPIKTEYWAPPIPDRSYDWSAYRYNWDLGDPIGYGRTEQEAIEHLKELEN